MAGSIRARSLYLYLRVNSGDKKWHQALRTKASGLICVVEGFGSILLGVVALKATPATTAIVRGCDHLQKFDSKRQPTGDTAMITRQMSHRPAWGGVHAKP